MSGKRVIVIGAGMGGLAAAVDLARTGHDVTVFESATTPGGKLRELLVGGQPVESGPTVLTMRWVFDELFADSGANLSERVELVPLELLARHAWSEAERLDLYADPERSADAIGEFSGAKAAKGYWAYRNRVREIYETLEETFLRSPLPTPIGLVRRSGGLSSLLKISPFETMWREIGRYFDDPRLQQLFGRYATYTGSSPFEAPATLMLVSHVEMAGVWTVRNGMGRLAEAMANLAEENGAAFHYESDVEELVVRRGRVCAVKLASGECVKADSVVINGDPAAVSAGLFGDEVRHAVPPVPRSGRSLSALTMSMRATARGFPLANHSVFFGQDYEKEFRELFEQRRLPSDPTVYVHCQDRKDSRSIDGPERILAILNAPADGDQRTFDPATVGTAIERAHGVLARAGLALDVHDCQITTPMDLNQRFPGTGGAVYGIATHGSRTTFKRPPSRTKVNGLYLAGGSTHPGAGVPNSTLSGRLAARAVREDMAVSGESATGRRGLWLR
ncbi:MAG: 1-hydroxycarotenoid 3,4-desaturase CrtD [Myxococcota bacterium]